MSNRFEAMLDNLAATLADSYTEARAHARAKNPQRAGHIGESTWESVLEQWGPGWPVVTRKYIVGPGGESNEVDIVVLKPDYPRSLASESSVLASGVAAAFSSKLTLRREHIGEAIRQKKRLIGAAGAAGGDVKRTLVGPFPFGLLAHSTELYPDADDFPGRVQDLYEELVHDPAEPPVTQPREELDAILVADRGFVTMARAAFVPPTPGLPGSTAGPMTSLMKYAGDETKPGTPIAQFITWLHSTLNPSGNSPLQSLDTMFGMNSSSGPLKRWPLTVYPANLRDPKHLLTPYGNPLNF